VDAAMTGEYKSYQPNVAANNKVRLYWFWAIEELDSSGGFQEVLVGKIQVRIFHSEIVLWVIYVI